MTLIQILEARKEALDVHEVAELLKVSERHIYELAADGSFPAFRVGKAIRFDPQDVADWLRRKKPEAEHRQQRETHEDHPNRRQESSTSLVHVWRNKVNSLKEALAMDASADVSSVKNS